MSVPRSHAESAECHDAVTRRLHWATALLVSVLWIIGQTTGWLPRGPARVDVWSVHVLLGFGLACVIVARIVWRLRQGALPSTGHGLLVASAAKIVHAVLYVLLVAVVTLGVINVFVHGFPLFNTWTFPGADKELRGFINHWHKLAANAIAIVALLHALAALVHHYVFRDEVLARMAPVFRRVR
jgi:cytochrome b561